MDEFSYLGLSTYEKRALEALLYGDLTAKDMTREADIPPGKVYSVLNSLKERKIVETTDTRPKKYFVPDAPASIGALIDSKRSEIELAFARARRLATGAARRKGETSSFFELGTTVGENKTIQMRSFKEAQKEVCQILNVHHRPDMNRESKRAWEKEIQLAISRGVVFRAIYPENAVLPPLLENLDPINFCVRRKSVDFVRCDIIDKKKVLIKLVHKDSLNFGGVLFFEDERFARNLQTVFEQFWEEAG